LLKGYTVLEQHEGGRMLFPGGKVSLTSITQMKRYLILSSNALIICTSYAIQNYLTNVSNPENNKCSS